MLIFYRQLTRLRRVWFQRSALLGLQF